MVLAVTFYTFQLLNLNLLYVIKLAYVWRYFGQPMVTLHTRVVSLFSPILPAYQRPCSRAVVEPCHVNQLLSAHSYFSLLVYLISPNLANLSRSSAFNHYYYCVGSTAVPPVSVELIKKVRTTGKVVMYERGCQKPQSKRYHAIICHVALTLGIFKQKRVRMYVLEARSSKPLLSSCNAHDSRL